MKRHHLTSFVLWVYIHAYSYTRNRQPNFPHCYYLLRDSWTNYYILYKCIWSPHCFCWTHSRGDRIWNYFLRWSRSPNLNCWSSFNHFSWHICSACRTNSCNPFPWKCTASRRMSCFPPIFWSLNFRKRLSMYPLAPSRSWRSPCSWVHTCPMSRRDRLAPWVLFRRVWTTHALYWPRLTAYTLHTRD